MALGLFRRLVAPYIFLPLLYVTGTMAYLFMSIINVDFPFRYHAEYTVGLFKVGAFYVLLASCSFISYAVSLQWLRCPYATAGVSAWAFAARRLARMLMVMGVITILIYTYLVISDFGVGRIWTDIILGNKQLGILTRYKERIPFIGAFHFLLPTAATLYAICQFHKGLRISALEWSILLGISVLRSFVSVARLYIVWTILPIIIVGLSSPDFRVRKRMGMRSIIGAIVFVGFFTLQGVLRSYRDGSWGSVAVYGGTMLLYYLVGGLHYSAVLGSSGSPYSFPIESTRWLQTIGTSSQWERSIDYDAFQATYGLPSFNTYGLFGTLYLDFGDWVFAVAMFIGLWLGILYALYRRKCVSGLILYSVVFPYLADSLRINAFVVTQGVIPIATGIMSAVILGLHLRIRRKRG